MGKYSFKRAEDGKSIPSVHSGLPMQPHYLIQPNGQPPIVETAYDGYGRWGGIDLFEWLAKTNAESLGLNFSGFHKSMIRGIGELLHKGDALEDTRNGSIWWVGKRNPVHALVTQHVPVNYDDYCHALGGTPNEMIDAGLLRERPVRDIIGLPYPIKISANKDAIYEHLPASGDCEHLGYFYPNEVDDLSAIVALDTQAMRDLANRSPTDTGNNSLANLDEDWTDEDSEALLSRPG
ncbi:hypothetical protein [Marinobacter salarius]|uniref:Uncharacterized protein n=1 Tax=Marinobacter salarius TaxID=1420917 RepID=A0A1W6KFQ6_9GAMM|nr:hypothetical protein [Marinobacter salarius]ARM86159.1 hypothetical protein MARSALSMR5_04139 [Marinobacter salarius]